MNEQKKASPAAHGEDPAGDGVRPVDSLLECLVFLMAHYGRAKSAKALTSGLAYDGQSMKPDLFAEAAQRLGLKTQVIKKDKIEDFDPALFPLVLILNAEKAVVMLSPGEIFDPVKRERRNFKPAQLAKQYAGYAILVHTSAEFMNPERGDVSELTQHWFWSLIWENRSIYGMVLLSAVFINLFGLVSPLFIMNVYDRVIPNSAIETGWVLGVGALTVYVFDFIMRTLRGMLIDLAGRRIDVMAMRRIYDQVLNIKLSQRPRSAGAFANMLREFDTVRDFFTSATITGLVDLPFTIFFLFVLFSLAGMFAFVLMGLLALVTLVGLALQVPLKAVVRKSSRSSEARHALLVETIHGLETIKAIGADGRFRVRYSSLVGESAAYGQSSRFISALGVNIATFVQQIASIILVMIGMYLVRDGDLTTGALIASVILSGRALAPVGSIANLLVRYHQSSGSLKTLDSLMSKPVDRPAQQQYLHRSDLKGGIAFEKVSFSYPGIKRQILHDVSFRIEPGEKVGVIGRIGSGKSTIARLMMGLYDPDAGTILTDGTDMRQIDPADLRSHFGYISQDVVLFNGSVRENIAASSPTASEAEILEASKAAGVHDFISRHPLGYDAPVGESGEGLSGGQRQAIALARTLLSKPCLLICDEPTNAMDLQAEMAFRSAINNEINGKTFVLITHKHAMLEMVDRLILIDHGRLIMDGPREKVVAELQSGSVKVAP